MNIAESIVKINGSRPGSTVAVFAGIHGNEEAGILALQELSSSLKIRQGTVYLVFANPLAIEKNVRFVEKNMNRCFSRENKGKTWEERRAHQLMDLLDNCDALLDLHGFNSENGEPFAICEPSAFEFAKKLPVKTIVSNLALMEPGATDAYMYDQGKVGVCLECGPNIAPEKYVPLAKEAVKQFLNHYGLVDYLVENSSETNPTIYKVIKVVKKETDNFQFNKSYQEFEQLRSGEVFATDGNQAYKAEDNNYIIFPRPQNKIGQEAFLIAEKLTDKF